MLSCVSVFILSSPSDCLLRSSLFVDYFHRCLVSPQCPTTNYPLCIYSPVFLPDVVFVNSLSFFQYFLLLEGITLIYPLIHMALVVSVE